MCLYYFVFMITVHFQSTVLSQNAPGAFPDGLQNSYPSLNWQRCQARARSQGTQDWGLGTSLSPRTKEQLLEVISVFMDQLYFHQTGGLYINHSQKLWQDVAKSNIYTDVKHLYWATVE